MTTTVVNKHHGVPYDVYIGRGSKWGNPFSHMAGTQAQFIVPNRDAAVAAYKEWILDQPELIASLHELRGKVLCCYCAPAACHGHVLAELADNQPYKSKESIKLESKELTLCFTGHRPKYFPDWDWKNPWTNPAAKRMIDWGTRDLNKIMEVYSLGQAWSGGALGWDQIAFWIVYKMQLAGLAIENNLAIPYAQQSNGWKSKELVERWHQMLKLANERVYTDTVTGYGDGPINVHTNLKLSLRNEFMVDNTDIVYAMWNGSSGGTKNCIDYALKNKKIVYATNPETGDFRRLQ